MVSCTRTSLFVLQKQIFFQVFQWNNNQHNSVGSFQCLWQGGKTDNNSLHPEESSLPVIPFRHLRGTVGLLFEGYPKALPLDTRYEVFTIRHNGNIWVPFEYFLFSRYKAKYCYDKICSHFSQVLSTICWSSDSTFLSSRTQRNLCHILLQKYSFTWSRDRHFELCFLLINTINLQDFYNSNSTSNSSLIVNRFFLPRHRISHKLYFQQHALCSFSLVTWHCHLGCHPFSAVPLLTHAI